MGGVEEVGERGEGEVRGGHGSRVGRHRTQDPVRGCTVPAAPSACMVPRDSAPAGHCTVAQGLSPSVTHEIFPGLPLFEPHCPTPIKGKPSVVALTSRVFFTPPKRCAHKVTTQLRAMGHNEHFGLHNTRQKLMAQMIIDRSISKRVSDN